MVTLRPKQQNRNLLAPRLFKLSIGAWELDGCLAYFCVFEVGIGKVAIIDRQSATETVYEDGDCWCKSKEFVDGKQEETGLEDGAEEHDGGDGEVEFHALWVLAWEWDEGRRTYISERVPYVELLRHRR